MSLKWSAKTAALVGFLFCVGMLAGAFILEYGMNMVPCPLCMLQRYITGFIGILFLIYLLLPRARSIQFAIISFFSFFGILVSGRQVYLQNSPDNLASACGPDLDYMLRHVPFRETLKMLYEGSGDCAHIQGTFLGLSLPAWSMIAFILLLSLAVVTLFKLRSSHRQ